MRDTKSLLLLLVSLLLVIVSFVLIWTWGYSFYNKNDEVKVNAKTVTVDSAAITNHIRDSLQKVYNETLHELDIQLDSTLSNTDSLKAQLDIKLSEFYRLRNEIASILKNRNANNNFTVAKQKIGELQTKVDDMRYKAQDVEAENKKLGDILTQITSTDKTADKNVKKIFSEKTNNTNSEKINPVYPVFTASDLKLSALIINADDKELETNTANKAEKLNGSFTVVNYNSQLANAEIVVVVLQPDGRVLKTSGWEAGTFNTPSGKKIYSYKMNFNYSRGEAKHLLFTLRSDKLSKGNYTMEVYYNGFVIGRIVKSLY